MSFNLKRGASSNASSLIPVLCYCPTCSESQPAGVLPKKIKQASFWNHRRKWGVLVNKPLVRRTSSIARTVSSPPSSQPVSLSLDGQQEDEGHQPVLDHDHDDDHDFGSYGVSRVRLSENADESGEPPADPRSQLEKDVDVLAMYRYKMACHAINNPDNKQRVYLEVYI